MKIYGAMKGDTRPTTGSRWSIWRKLLTPGAGTPFILVAISCLFSVSVSAGGSSSGPLVFAGSGTNLAITRLLAEAFMRTHPEIKIEVPDSIGSTGGIRAAADGAIAVGLISRPLKEREKGIGLTVLPYARTAAVIGAHPSVTDDGITHEELVQIYRGEKTRWKDGHEIIVLSRNAGESAIKMLEEGVPGFREAYAESHKAKRWIVLYTDQAMNRALARTPHAIGISDMGTIAAERLPIKALKLNGVPPTPENVLSGKYPLVKTLAFVFQKDGRPAGVKAFLDYVRSRKGGKILKDNGFLPGG